MENREIERKVKKAYTNATPDLKGSVLTYCAEQKGKVILMTNKKNNRSRWTRYAAGIAAALVLVIALGAGFGVYRSHNVVASVVSLDVNPSVEIEVNRKEKVLDVRPLNDDGKVILGDMNFKGDTLDETINALVGSMLRGGYLTDLANSILVSVDDDDAAHGADLQARLMEEIGALFANNSFGGAVLGQTVEKSNGELKTVAEQYGITTGKAQLIAQIIEQNPLHTYEELAPLSINELSLLNHPTEEKPSRVETVGSASEAAYIGEAAAKAAALKHAGFQETDISRYRYELDFDDGVMIYEVEFVAGGYEYDYDIHATTGAVLDVDKEREDDRRPAGGNTVTSKPAATTSSKPAATTPSKPATSDYIGEERAKEIALAKAGVSADAIRGYSCELDWDDGRVEYEIEFRSGGYEYSMNVHAETGEVYDFEKDRDD